MKITFKTYLDWIDDKVKVSKTTERRFWKSLQVIGSPSEQFEEYKRIARSDAKNKKPTITYHLKPEPRLEETLIRLQPIINKVTFWDKLAFAALYFLIGFVAGRL